MKRIFFLKLILITCLYFSAHKRVYGQKSTLIKFEKIGQISGSEEYIIGAPTDIEIIDGKIYIADQMDLKIKVFSQDGAFIREMGGRGRGPAEFQHFTALWKSLNNNTLNVIDYLNRKIVTFSESGEVLEEEVLKNKRITWPREVHPLSPSANLIVYQPTGIKSSDLFHVFDNNFENYERSFSLPKAFKNADKVKKVFRNFQPGNSVVSGSTLFFAPNFFEGKIYSMKINDKNSWNSHVGTELEGSSYELLSPNSKLHNDNDVQIYDHKMHSPHGTFVFRLYNTTKALFKTADGYIAHFVEVNKNGKKQQGIELYNKVGSFIGYQPYFEQKLRSDKYTSIAEHPKAMDENNRVYTINRKGEVPVISIYQFEYQE